MEKNKEIKIEKRKKKKRKKKERKKKSAIERRRYTHSCFDEREQKYQ